MHSVTLKAEHKDPVIEIILDTILQERQTLVFCSSKKGAESQAEKTAAAIKTRDQRHEQLAEAILSVFANPTKQCQRLAKCIQKGVAFHHAGLASKQREIIEDAFRKGEIHAICSTPTLAAGLDLPAFRAIIRDTKRFGQRGMAPIPVLEYLQMAGRAGRPGKETHGEAILLTKDSEDEDYLLQTYIKGEVEDIFSKLAVEPVLRTYVLSLIAANIIKDKRGLYEFFDKTFYAHQFGDTTKLHFTLDRMIRLLQEWDMLEQEKKAEPLFSSAASLLTTALGGEQLKATLLGKRVSELYLDPLTAHQLIEQFPTLEKISDPSLMVLHLLTCTLEMRPLIRSRAKDATAIHAFLEEHTLAIDEYDFYTHSQDNYEDTIQTTRFFLSWVNELHEEKILEEYNVRPGEITAKTQRALWLLHAGEELARIKKQHILRKHFSKLQVRVQHGVKPELLPLLQFKNIGRARARTLYNAGIKDAGGVERAEGHLLIHLLGPKRAKDLKSQVGEDIEIHPVKKTGQSRLGDF